MEFIHTATLLHDDVIDQALIRRGKTSANKIFGNSVSILVGDFLCFKAFTLMTTIGNIDIFDLFLIWAMLCRRAKYFSSPNAETLISLKMNI